MNIFIVHIEVSRFGCIFKCNQNFNNNKNSFLLENVQKYSVPNILLQNWCSLPVQSPLVSRSPRNSDEVHNFRPAQLLDSRSEFCCTLGSKDDRNMDIVPFLCGLLIFWKQFSSPDLEIILNFWIRTPTQGNWSRGGGGGEECKNCREMEFLGRREKIQPRWKCIEVRSNSSIHAAKQEFSVVTNWETHEYGFPKYRNTEIQESECGSGAGWLGNTETRNVWQPLVLPPPPNTQIHSFYYHPKIHKYINTKIHMPKQDNLKFVNPLFLIEYKFCRPWVMMKHSRWHLK